jgi:putative lipoprotein
VKCLRSYRWCLAVLLLTSTSIACGQTAPTAAASALGGTSWQLVKFQASDGKTLTPDDKAKYTLAFASDGGLSVRIDCNRGHGMWKSEGPDQIRFGRLALTRAMCPPAPLNDRIPKDWDYVRSYTLTKGRLFLSLMADGGIYEFEPLGATGAATGRVKGTATYRERMALPPNAVFEATLEDVSKTNAAPQTVGEARVEGPGNPPIHFEIVYDPSRIAPDHRYAVRARVAVDGKVWFVTDHSYPALSAGQNNEVALLLRRAATSTAADGEPSLEKTHWKLIHLSETVVTVTSEEREPHLILNPESHRVSGSGGCNGLTGSYELHGNELTFTQMATTMMACPEGMDTEKAFLKALTEAKTWKITEQQLELFDAGGNVVARFEAR